MALTFLGKDPNSPDGNSATIWDNGDTYVIQGMIIVDPLVLADVGVVPAHETVVEIPKVMVQFLSGPAGG